ncbi:hypothetical protein D3H35_28110 [Cohnella faecalis]|uniref:Uncharacterized protein n=1 Tax=Cohnella faecalis TaxID=2315694 RepID=A0A398CHE7_9BACL|nr:hypothetical protein D3H35_28110 [Cohnella faecalis]
MEREECERNPYRERNAGQTALQGFRRNERLYESPRSFPFEPAFAAGLRRDGCSRYPAQAPNGSREWKPVRN